MPGPGARTPGSALGCCHIPAFPALLQSCRLWALPDSSPYLPPSFLILSLPLPCPFLLGGWGLGYNWRAVWLWEGRRSCTSERPEMAVSGVCGQTVEVGGKPVVQMVGVG